MKAASRFVCIFLLLYLSCSSSQKESQEIPIGYYGPLSGNMASFGITCQRGIELGLQEINRTGVMGKRLKLFVQDDRGNPEEAQTAASRLITRERVVAILGNPSSAGSLAGAPVCQQNRIPMISPTATNIKVTQAGDFIFRVCWIDPFQAQTMARFAVEELKADTVGLFFDVGSDYSTGLAEIFAGTAEKLGAKVTVRQSFASGDTNFAAQLTNIISTNPDVLFLPTYYNETGLIMRQLRAMTSKITVLGSDGWDAPQLMEIGGEALNGSFYCTHFLPTDPDPAVQHFVTAFKRVHAGNPSMGEALAYDAVRLLADAMVRSSSFDPVKVRDAIAATKDFAGVTGRITIDENRNALKQLLVVKVENNSARLYKKVS